MESADVPGSGAIGSGVAAVDGGIRRAVWMSQREACDLLGSGTGIDRETARRALKAGLAGEPIRLRGTALYERGRIEVLSQRRVLGPPMPEVCLQGTFVARLGLRRATDGLAGSTLPGWRGADTLAPLAEQFAAASGPWRISPWGRVKLRGWIQERGFVPFVATAGGYVVLGAEVVELAPLPQHAGQAPATLVLRAPGDWFDSWRDARFPTRPGGPWQMWPDGLWPVFEGAHRRGSHS